MLNSPERPTGPSPENLENLKIDQTQRIYRSLHDWAPHPEIFLTREQRNQAIEVKEKIKRNEETTPEEKKLYYEYQLYQKNKLRKNWFTIVIGQVQLIAMFPHFIADAEIREKLNQKAMALQEKIEQTIEKQTEISATQRKLDPQWVEEGDQLLREALEAMINNLSDTQKEEFNEWVAAQKEAKKETETNENKEIKIEAERLYEKK